MPLGQCSIRIKRAHGQCKLGQDTTITNPKHFDWRFAVRERAVRRSRQLSLVAAVMLSRHPLTIPFSPTQDCLGRFPEPRDESRLVASGIPRWVSPAVVVPAAQRTLPSDTPHTRSPRPAPLHHSVHMYRTVQPSVYGHSAHAFDFVLEQPKKKKMKKKIQDDLKR